MTRHVLVLTPLGRGGAGGIDRLMDSLRDDAARLAPEMEVSFVTTRGRSIALSPFHMGAAIARIVFARLTRRLDVVHVNLAANASTYRKALLAGLCRSLGTPYVLHLHGADFAEFWPRDGSGRRRMIDRLFEGASSLIVLGTPWRNLVVERLPAVSERVRVVPNAAPAPPPRREPRDGAGPVIVLFLGQLGERKGSPTLVEALATMAVRTPWRAVIAGDGPVAETRAAVAAAGLAERVDVPGWLGSAAVTDLLAQADILALPSLAENLPMSVIEGMAAGLAVIATPAGATADIVHDGETGLLIAPADVSGLAVALQRTIDDAVLRRRLGEAARAFHHAHLDVPRFTESLAAAWRDAIERGAARPSTASARPFRTIPEPVSARRMAPAPPPSYLHKDIEG